MYRECAACRVWQNVSWNTLNSSTLPSDCIQTEYLMERSSNTCVWTRERTTVFDALNFSCATFT